MADQAASCAPMIQCMPNRSFTMPNPGDQKVGPKGISTRVELRMHDKIRSGAASIRWRLGVAHHHHVGAAEMNIGHEGHRLIPSVIFAAISPQT